LNISPIPLEQLAHPVFKVELPDYWKRKIAASQVDDEHFKAAGNEHLAETARWWQACFTTGLGDSNVMGQDILQGLHEFNDAGMIEIITCAATPGHFSAAGQRTKASWLRSRPEQPRIASISANLRAACGFPSAAPPSAGVWQTPVIPERDSSRIERTLGAIRAHRRGRSSLSGGIQY
jgi:1,4-alpha-glucan branching enzyme